MLFIIKLCLLQINGKLYPLTNSEKKVPVNGGVITLNLYDYDVPNYATSVVVYSYVKSGYVGADVDGSLNVESNTDTGKILRKVFFHTYSQSAWAFNSEHLTLPIGPSHSITAKVDTTAKLSNFLAAVQVVGYEIGCD